MSSTAPSSHAGHPVRATLAGWATRPLSPARPSAVTRPFAVTRLAAPRASGKPLSWSFRGSLLPLLIAVFALLNAGDLISTYIGLHAGMREGNPLMNWLLAQYGFDALIVYKLLVIAGVGVGVLFLRAFEWRVAHVTIWVCNLLVLGVVISNVMQFTLGR